MAPGEAADRRGALGGLTCEPLPAISISLTDSSNVDLRFDTLLSDTGLVGVDPAREALGVPHAKLASAGSPGTSLLLHRVETLGAVRMPTIGSNVVDQKAVELLTDWIKSLE